MSVVSDMDDLSVLLFDELHRLMAASTADGEDVRAEIERAKTVQALAAQVVSTRRLVLDSVELSFKVHGEAVGSTAAALLEGGEDDGAGT